MGYYTTHKLEIIKGDNNYTDYKQEIGEISGYGSSLFSGEEHKWYESNEHMIDYSKNHPNTVFKLSGEGEESGDIWSRYYKNGKVQSCKAKIVVDDYDESKLE